MKWPFMLKSDHDAVRVENYTLRDALREANKELLKHRQFIAGIKSGQIDVVHALDKLVATKATLDNGRGMTPNQSTS